MQESGPQWDPIIIEHPMPVEMRLFVLFVLFVLVFFLIRVIQLSRFAWRTRKLRSNLESLVTDPDALATKFGELSLASIRAASLQRGSWLTLLLALTVTAEQATQRLEFVSTEKVVGLVALAGTFSEILSVFALGAGVSAMLYAAFAIFEGRFSRLRTGIKEQ